MTFNEPHVPFVSSVTLCPAEMVTLSPAPGTPEGLQVPAVFQFVEPVLVLATPNAGKVLPRIRKRMTSAS